MQTDGNVVVIDGCTGRCNRSGTGYPINARLEPRANPGLGLRPWAPTGAGGSRRSQQGRSGVRRQEHFGIEDRHPQLERRWP